MPGRPILQALSRKIEKLGGEDFVYGQLSNGITYSKLAILLGCDRRLFFSWRKMSEDRLERCEYFRVMGAGVLAESSVDELVDMQGQDVTSAEVSLARATSNSKRWLAGKVDPATWGEKQVVDINVSADNLFMDALRAGSKKWLARDDERLRLEAGDEDIVEGDFTIEEGN